MLYNVHVDLIISTKWTNLNFCLIKTFSLQLFIMHIICVQLLIQYLNHDIIVNLGLKQ